MRGAQHFEAVAAGRGSTIAAALNGLSERARGRSREVRPRQRGLDNVNVCCWSLKHERHASR